MDYPGNVITKNQVAPTQTSASGVWTMDEVAAAVANNSWPFPKVVNPISRSLRFNSAVGAYLNRTPGSAPTNADIGTWSFWVKRAKLGQEAYVFGARDGGNLVYAGIRFNASDQLEFTMANGGSAIARRVTTQVFRDPSSWYHFVVVYNSPSATASQRIRMYVNGVEITSFSTSVNPSENQDLIRWAANGVANYIGNEGTTPGNYGEYYLTETYYIDGQALGPTEFGFFDLDTGVWVPKVYNGTYGTNGFYLKFSDNASTAALGTDYSGNSNTWTLNNFSVNDSMVDSPTSYGTDTGVGGEVRGNYCTLNPLTLGTSTTINNGNLTLATTYGSDIAGVASTIGVNSGKWYWEIAVSNHSTYPYIGISSPSRLNYLYGGAMYAVAARGGGSIEISGSDLETITTSATGVSWTSGDVVMMALDCDARKLWFGKNGTWFNSGSPTGGTNQQASWTVSSLVFPMIMGYAGQGNGSSFNFGQRAFAHTAPSGFKALCTQNLPTPTIADGSQYFDIDLFTGTSADLTRTGIQFQPDLLWFKATTSAVSHRIFDVVRGLGVKDKELSSNNTNAEGATNSCAVTATSDGYSFSDGSTTWYPNFSGNDVVSWLWKAGGSVSANNNNDGTITSTVSANTTSGVSIVTWTGNGGGSSTVGHGLGVTPSFIIVKFRNSPSSWSVYTASLGATKRLTLETSDAEATNIGYWNNTSPTSTVFTLGSALTQSYNYVAYCFAAVPGFSAFGSYTGNGSANGPFVYTGFRPRFVMYKSTSTSQWGMFDTTREVFNPVGEKLLRANLINAEADNNDTYDFLSNGFKLRLATFEPNKSGETYIYMAFAENPFKYSNAR